MPALHAFCTLGFLRVSAALQLSKTSHSPLWHSRRNICFFWRLACGLTFIFWLWSEFHPASDISWFDRLISSHGTRERSRTVSLEWGKRLVKLRESRISTSYYCFFIIKFLGDHYATDELVTNTCKSMCDICFYAPGASLSASFGGHRRTFVRLFQRVAAGSPQGSHPVSKHPNRLWSPRSNDVRYKSWWAARVNPDSQTWPGIRAL